jgi:hypothetical protein
LGFLNLPPTTTSSRDIPATSSPLSPPLTQQPAVTRPASSVLAASTHPNPPQNRTSTQSRQVPVVATLTTTDKDNVIQHQRDEIVHLQAQLVQLATTPASTPQAIQPVANPNQAGTGNMSGGADTSGPHAILQQALFMNEAAVEQAQAQLVAKAVR